MIATITDETLSLEKICNEIMGVDSKIRFVGIINEMGRLLAGGMRPGTKPLIEEGARQMLFMEVALRIRMRHEYDSLLGPVNFTISHRDKILVMSIPYKNYLLYVSAETDTDLCTVPYKILEIIRRPTP